VGTVGALGRLRLSPGNGSEQPPYHQLRNHGTKHGTPSAVQTTRAPQQETPHQSLSTCAIKSSSKGSCK
jgi:hypothetical protein